MRTEWKADDCRLGLLRFGDSDGCSFRGLCITPRGGPAQGELYAARNSHNRWSAISGCRRRLRPVCPPRGPTISVRFYPGQPNVIVQKLPGGGESMDPRCR